MNSNRFQRVDGALQELRAGINIEEIGDGKFEVKGKYEVDPVATSCSCPDHEYNERFCKHIVATNLALMWGEISLPENSANPVPDKPKMMTLKVPRIPAQLKEMDQWVAWKQKLHENKDGSKRWTKVPVNANEGGFAKSNDSSTWSDFRTSHRNYVSTDTDTCGIGFVVSEADNIVGIDIDDCRDPETGRFTKEAADLIGRAESYTEISPSGTGARIFVLGEKETTNCEADLPGEAHIEVYDNKRFLTVTGQHVESTPREIRESPVLAEIEKLAAGEESSLDDF